MAPRKHPLVAFREANGDLTQAQCAERFGITQSHWSRIESGETGARPKLAKKIARWTGVSLERLLNFGDNKTGRKVRRRAVKPIESPSEML